MKTAFDQSTTEEQPDNPRSAPDPRLTAAAKLLLQWLLENMPDEAQEDAPLAVGDGA